MNTINLAYIRLLYNYLFGITDDELQEKFDIERPSDRENFFSEAKKDFQKFGPKTQDGVVDAIEYILSSQELDKYWRQVIPHDLPIRVISDKREYLRRLFVAVTGRKPNESLNIEGISAIDRLNSNWHPSE